MLLNKFTSSFSPRLTFSNKLLVSSSSSYWTYLWKSCVSNSTEVRGPIQGLKGVPMLWPRDHVPPAWWYVLPLATSWTPCCFFCYYGIVCVSLNRISQWFHISSLVPQVWLKASKNSVNPLHPAAPSRVIYTLFHRFYHKAEESSGRTLILGCLPQ